MGAAEAQEAGSTTVNVAPCREIREDSARLICYDRLIETTPETGLDRVLEGAAETSSVSATAGPAAPGVAAQRSVPASAIVSDTVEPPEPREFMAEVAAVREIQPGRLEITLTNGQVWRQTNSDRYLLQPGHEVRLYTSRFGQYWRLTSTTLRGFVQVERVQ